MPTFVKFWGTRGSIPTPGPRTRRYGGNTSCVEVRIDETLFLCDGGTGLREFGVDWLGRGRPFLSAHMFFSHMHWDHIQGFPFFTPAYMPGSQLTVYEVAPGDTRVQRLLRGQMSSEYFPVSFADLGATIQTGHFTDSVLAIDGVRVSCLEQRHPGRSFAYSFERGGTKVVYATDSELDLLLLDSDAVVREPNALRRLPEHVVRFVEGADLLIADGQYTDAEYGRKVGWGHARASTVVDLAVQAGVRNCAIFHHDPMQSDEMVEEKVRAARQRAAHHGSSVSIFGAREGLELKY